MKAIISVIEVGEMVVTKERPGSGFPGMRCLYAVRAKLLVWDVEEAAPATFCHYTTGAGDASTGLSVRSMEVSRLPEGERALIDHPCGNAFPCQATVYGHSGEIEAERRVNLYPFAGSVATIIGLVGDHVQFHGIRP